MATQALMYIFAIILLISVTIVFLIDVSVELGIKPALRLKWTLLWYGARYVAIVCGVLLALNVLFD